MELGTDNLGYQAILKDANHLTTYLSNRETQQRILHSMP